MLKMADDTQNKQAMKEAVDTLNLIISTNSTPKTIKKSITDLVADLVKEEYSKINPGMKRKSKEQAIAYAALENAWFHHETDTFPAPLKDYDGKPYSNDQN